MSKKRLKFVGYMDGNDFLYEQGQPMEGSSVFSSVGALNINRPCVRECGIVRVSVELLKWVSKAKDPLKEKKVNSKDKNVAKKHRKNQDRKRKKVAELKNKGKK